MTFLTLYFFVSWVLTFAYWLSEDTFAARWEWMWWVINIPLTAVLGMVLCPFIVIRRLIPALFD